MADEENVIRISKDAMYGFIIVGLAALLVLSVMTQGFGLVKPPAAVPAGAGGSGGSGSGSQGGSGSAGTTGGSAQGQGTAGLQQLSVDVGALPALGQASAPVTIVEFSDFQCPFCGRLYSDAEAQIRTNYINSGKVKFYYRDFPLTSIHPDAMAGAIAGRCANDQGKFWDMHDKLFQNQDTWSSMADPKSTLEQYAKDLGLDSSKFNSCYEAQTHVSEINADEAAGQGYGVQGTPGVYIKIPKGKIDLATLQGAAGNGLTVYENQDEYVVFVPGAYPYSTFDAVLSKVSY